MLLAVSALTGAGILAASEALLRPDSEPQHVGPANESMADPGFELIEPSHPRNEPRLAESVSVPLAAAAPRQPTVSRPPQKRTSVKPARDRVRQSRGHALEEPFAPPSESDRHGSEHPEPSLAGLPTVTPDFLTPSAGPRVELLSVPQVSASALNAPDPAIVSEADGTCSTSNCAYAPVETDEVFRSTSTLGVGNVRLAQDHKAETAEGTTLAVASNEVELEMPDEANELRGRRSRSIAQRGPVSAANTDRPEAKPAFRPEASVGVPATADQLVKVTGIRLPVTVQGLTVGSVPIVLFENDDAAIQVSELLDLVSSRMDKTSFERLRFSNAAQRYASLEQLKAAGFTIGYDKARDELVLTVR